MLSIVRIIELDIDFAHKEAKMPKKRRSCKNNPDSFCYICGELILLNIKGT